MKKEAKKMPKQKRSVEGQEKNLIDEVVAEIKQKPKKREHIEWISTGSTILDLITGGGFPVGKIVNVVGDNSSGKTLFACELIANAAHKKKKMKWVYDDAEAGFSFDSKAMYGIDIVDVKRKPSFTVEDFEYNLHKELESLNEDEYLIYVLDSLDALSSQSEIDYAEERRKSIESGAAQKGTYGMQKQKFLSEFFRLQANKIKDKKCLLIIISQVRTRIEMFPGPKYTRSGGKALDFYAAIIIWLAEAEKHKKLNRTVGVTIKARTTKNKVGLPFREGFVDVLFDYGIDDVSSNLVYLNDARTDTGKMKKAGKFTFQEKTDNLKALVNYIEENNLEAELKQAVIEKWKAIDEKISSNDRKARFK
jgi:recombination protein RecA